MIKNPNAIVKKGYLTKEGNKPNRRVEARLMVCKSKALSWYHDQKEFEQGKKPLGVIYMHAIYHCVPAKGVKSTDDLNVSLSFTIDKHILRLERAPGGKRTVKKKAGESSHSALRINSKEMNGSHALSIFERRQYTIALSKSIATFLSHSDVTLKRKLEKQRKTC